MVNVKKKVKKKLVLFLIVLTLIIPTVLAFNTSSGNYRLDFSFLPCTNFTSGDFKINTCIDPFAGNFTSGAFIIRTGFPALIGKAFFAPNIIAEGTSPTTPTADKSIDVLIWAHLNDTNQDNLTYARFWVTAPNSSIRIEGVNGTEEELNSVDYEKNFTSSTFRVTSPGDWLWNWTADDNNTLSGTTNSSGSFTITDTINPDVNITNPRSTRTEYLSSVDFRKTTTDVLEIDTGQCSYNVTFQDDSIDIANKSIDCFQNESFILTKGNGKYTLGYTACDTSNNCNHTSVTFTHSYEPGATGGAGGGGSSGQSGFALAIACTNDFQCLSNYCFEGVCDTAPVCGDGICETAKGEGYISCPKDCNPFNQAKGKWGESKVLQFLVLIFGVGLFLLFLRPEKIKERWKLFLAKRKRKKEQKVLDIVEKKKKWK